MLERSLMVIYLGALLLCGYLLFDNHKTNKQNDRKCRLLNGILIGTHCIDSLAVIEMED
jgi:hypothetical protein